MKLPLMHSHGETSDDFNLVSSGHFFEEKVVSGCLQVRCFSSNLSNDSTPKFCCQVCLHQLLFDRQQ